MEAGRRAGVKTCAVLYGYGKRAEMERWSPDYWIESPVELLTRCPVQS
jgi:phosphoglycolate phosphatase-like HAD superfamily hydrolase